MQCRGRIEEALSCGMSERRVIGNNPNVRMLTVIVDTPMRRKQRQPRKENIKLISSQELEGKPKNDKTQIIKISLTSLVHSAEADNCNVKLSERKQRKKSHTFN